MIESKLIKCDSCDGTGKYDCIAQLYNPATHSFEPQPPVRMNCQMCQGSGKIDPIVIAARKEASEAFWCSCTDRSGVTYHSDNTPGAMCAKHHYICNDCDKVAQVG